MTRIIESAESSGNSSTAEGFSWTSRAGVGAVSSLLTICAGFSAGDALAASPLPQACQATGCGPNIKGFVQYGNATSLVNGNTLTVTQSSAQAILNWQQFNIANGYSVNFVQPSSTASVLNNIWSSDPSVIAGALKANGNVYLYNQNGIVFDKGAQVNVGSLVASTLPFAPVSGSANDPDALFKKGPFSNTVSGNSVAPAFECTSSTCATTPGAVTVSSGATLTSAAEGHVILIGSAVTNNGTINTPDGQAILGAGSQVYLVASSDPALRGFLIEVNATGVSGAVTNNGTISADRGNITLAGLVVTQAGQLSATTSVNANGSIYLVAGDTSGGQDFASSVNGFGKLLPNNGGTVTLEPGSVTQVLPDPTDTGTVSQQNLASSFLPSQVGVVGQTVTMAGNATIHAPSGNVALSAAKNPAAQAADQLTGNADADGGRIYLDSSSTIDVSGLLNVPVSVTQNILNVTLEGNDLADDPQLRSGFLHGQHVVVNASQGSTLFDVTPYKGNIALGLEQIMTAGGSIALHTDGDLIARAGSTLNVSGGSVAFQGGYADSTTKLISGTGKVYDIGSAPTNLQYTGLANSYSYVDPTWGTQTNLTSKTYYPGYIQGANAGSVQVWGPQVYLGGSLQASTIAGPYQRQTSSLNPGASSVPFGGLLTVGCNCPNGGTGKVYDGAPSVVFMDDGLQTIPENFNYLDPNSSLPPVLQDVIELSPAALSNEGFNRLSVFSGGAVTLTKGTDISLAPGGAAFSVTANQLIDIAGDIRAPGGSVSLTTTSGPGAASPSHDITVEPDAVVDTSGLWVNDSPLVTTALGTAPIVNTGGSITVAAAGNVNIGDSARLDVSGGGWVGSNNVITKGSAGSISLSATYQAGSDPTVPFTGQVKLGTDVALVGNSLAAAGGGQLAISSGSMTIGWQPLGSPGELLLAPTFFNNSGFQTYILTGENALSVGGTAAGLPSVLVNPIVESLAFTGNPLLARTGTAIASFTQLASLPATQRSAAKITLATTSSSVTGTVNAPNSGNLFVADNASIVTDAGGAVTLKTNSNTGSITVLGNITAPAGSITLQIGNFAPNGPSGAGYVPSQQILLGPSASLDAPAVAQVDTLNTLGYRQGSVLSGGTVTLAAYRGYVVTDPGSTIDVSGAATTIDIVDSNGVKTATTVTGNAGTVAIDAREGLLLQGAMLGNPAQANGTTIAGAGGGTLSIGLDLFDFGTTQFANSGQAFNNPYPLSPRTLTLTDQQTVQLPISGTANISEQTLMSGGFDNILLKSSDVIAVDGSVALSSRASLTLDSPLLRAAPGASLQLTSAHVLLGNYFNQSDYFNTDNLNTPGNAASSTNPLANPIAATVLASSATCFAQCTGTLAVNAQLIDVRGLSGWAGFATENLTSSGDVRFGSAQNIINLPPSLPVPADDVSVANFRSGLFTSGTLNLTAQQAYPTTYTDFSLSAGAGVNILPGSGSVPGVPLSAGGILTINAPTINQSGVVRAPLGEITLSGATVALESGSLTSVSADGATIPYGSTQNGQQWTYSPAAGNTNVVTAPVAKEVNLNGASVFMQKGATVDLSGGGDLLAYEWIKGPGGSTDVLNPQSGANLAGVNGYQYAIVPTLGSQFAPVDSQFAQQAVASGQTIYLSGVPGLASGTYALLPARYALLPGAFAVRVVQSNSDMALGSAAQQANGSYLAAGRLGTAGTSVIDSRTSTVLVAPSTVVQTQSQYTLTSGNVFFANAAAAAHAASPALPADAGALQLAATTNLVLNSHLNLTPGSYTVTDSSGKSTTVSGAGGFVSVQGSAIEVVDAATAANTSAPNGVLMLDAQSLDSLGATTLILGGTVHQGPTGEEITVASTKSVELANTTDALSGPDIILAAQDTIAVDPGALVNAKGTLSTSPSTLVVNGAGALLRASGASLASIALEPTTASDYIAQNPAGQLSIGSAANVSGSGSVLLYAAGNAIANPNAAIAAPALGVYSSRVSVGDVPGGGLAPNGLILTGQLLSTLSSSTALTIGSTSTIDFYGAVNLGTGALRSLTLDAAALDGYDTASSKANVNLQGSSIAFLNSNATSPPAYNNGGAPTGTGALTLTATGSAGQSGQILLGAGNKTINGFDAGVTLAAAGEIQTQGQGAKLSIVSAANAPVGLTLQSAALTSSAGSDQTIVVPGVVTIAQAASTATLPTAPLGGKITIESAQGINQSGTINLPAGILELHATAGDVVLGGNSVTSAAGAVQSFTVTNAVAPAGQISLIADAGNVTLSPGATVDVSGATSADGKTSGSAGALSVSTGSSSQFAFAGANLKGAAATGQLQGNFNLDVGQGLADSGPAGNGLSALVDALQSGGFTGDLSLRTRGDASVTIANTTNRPNGITASSFTLTADQGTIDVLGEINTSGGNALNAGGGAISLWAQNGLTLESSARLLADAGSGGPAGANGAPFTNQGGNVTLATANGYLNLQGGTISMLGSAGTSADGWLTLRAPRTANQQSVSLLTPVSGTVEVDTHNPIVVEGYQCYGACTAAARSLPASNITLGDPSLGAPSQGTLIDVTTNGALYADAFTLVGNGNGQVLDAAFASGFSNKFGASAPPVVQVRPGIEIDSTGDLTLAGIQIGGNPAVLAWDLNTWNAALGAPVDLTLRAGGNLIVAASLSDGFTIRGTRAVRQWTFGESGPVFDSGSYRLAAGADLASANPLSVVPQDTNSVGTDSSLAGTGNLVLTPGQLIRTGDGSIQIATGNDVLMGYSVTQTGSFLESDPLTTTAIYTAGVPSVLTAEQALVFQGPVNNPNVPAFATGGGNVTISATNNIRSAPGAEAPSDWVWRQGKLNDDGSIAANTTWWLEIGNFQGIGALGGGNVNLTAGADVIDVTAAIPTTGRLLGEAGTTPVLSNLLLTGGGALSVRAGGNISSGVYEDDWGNASLLAGGALNGHATPSQELPGVNPTDLQVAVRGDPTTTLIYPLLFLGTSDFSVNARDGVRISYIGNTTDTPESQANITASTGAGGHSSFFTYGATSGVTLASTAGDVVLDFATPAFPLAIENNSNANMPNLYFQELNLTLPPTLNLTASNGDIDILATTNTVQLFPSATGNLNLLAQGYITGSTTHDLTQPFALTMAETDPLQWPSALNPAALQTALPSTPLHSGDMRPINIVAETGSISKSTLNFPKAANIVAGGDIDELTLNGKNLQPSDVTLVAAGGNINYTTPTMEFTNALLANSAGIQLAGTGFLEVLAGGSINLGDGAGFTTSGNLTDSRLPSTGATALTGAGFGQNPGGGLRLPATNAFITKYFAPDNSGNPGSYGNLLVPYMQQLEPTAYVNATYATALTGFEGLTFQQQLPLMNKVLSTIFDAAAVEHGRTQSASAYVPGYTAINTLFPTKDAAGNALTYTGDIDMFFSQIKTEQGGDIDLWVPGGSVIVGVPNPPNTLNVIKAGPGGIPPAAANLGLLVLASGAVDGFANQSFEVNQSRILTLQGGNIILWASNGDIDAGKGAKSASGASPPVIQTDGNGNLTVNPIGTVSGSGIGQLLTGPGQTPGVVDLIAPKGTVNAGDAGIRVAGDLHIAAVQVVGAGNITVGGTSTGVPVSEAGALSGALSGANSMGDAGKNTVDQLSQNLGAAATFQQLSEALTPTFIVVKMFCLGVDCQLH